MDSNEINQAVLNKNVKYIRWSPLCRYEQKIKNISKTGLLLDVGCGTSGRGLKRFSSPDLIKIGIDPSKKALSETIHNAENIHVFCAVSENIPFKSNSFDMIVVYDVLHHVNILKKTVSEIHRCLKSGGFCYILETVDDNPLIKIYRDLFPEWRGMPVTQRFGSRKLKSIFEKKFLVMDEGKCDWIIWIFDVYFIERFDLKIANYIYKSLRFFEILFSKLFYKYSKNYSIFIQSSKK